MLNVHLSQFIWCFGSGHKSIGKFFSSQLTSHGLVPNSWKLNNNNGLHWVYWCAYKYVQLSSDYIMRYVSRFCTGFLHDMSSPIPSIAYTLSLVFHRQIHVCSVFGRACRGILCSTVLTLLRKFDDTYASWLNLTILLIFLECASPRVETPFTS